MCLQTTWVEPKVAEEDIVVYKEVMKPGISKVCSPYRGFYYILGEVYETYMGETQDAASYDMEASFWKDRLSERGIMWLSIGEGFHSAIRKERLASGGNFIFKCIIPKGSLYYKDGTGLIVSNKIKIVGEAE